MENLGFVINILAFDKNLSIFYRKFVSPNLTELKTTLSDVKINYFLLKTELFYQFFKHVLYFNIRVFKSCDHDSSA